MSARQRCVCVRSFTFVPCAGLIQWHELPHVDQREEAYHDAVSESPMRIYLDQWLWVDLARANTGHVRGTSYIPVLDYLRKARAMGAIACPLSSTHYMELQGNQNFRQRSDVATVMAELSGFCALSGIGPLRRAELDQALFKRFGRPNPPRKLKPHDWGYDFALSGAPKELKPEGPAESLHAFRSQLGDEGFKQLESWANYEIQLGVLRGPSDSTASVLRRDYGYRPEESINVTESRVRRERDLVQQLANDPAWTRRIGDIVAARTLCWEVLYLCLRRWLL
jgi:hypothetical protein